MFSRKELLKNSALAVSTLSITQTLLADDHDHSKMPASPSSKNKYSKAMMSALHCKLAAELCINHCISELAKGEKSMAACLKTATETKSVCDSFISLAALESNFTKKIAILCIEVCKACEAECKKHAAHHQVCKDCMECCKSCIKELSSI
jgi:Cys-rich four helix bundle protein (predicted Tat secretion target)